MDRKSSIKILNEVNEDAAASCVHKRYLRAIRDLDVRNYSFLHKSLFGALNSVLVSFPVSGRWQIEEMKASFLKIKRGEKKIYGKLKKSSFKRFIFEK